MAPFIVLVAVMLLLRLVGQLAVVRLRDWTARTRGIAAVALILFLVAVLPANIHAAMTQVTLAGQPVTPLVPRVALQGLFIALLWWAGINAGHRPSDW